jgi:hypothetical protein
VSIVRVVIIETKLKIFLRWGKGGGRKFWSVKDPDGKRKPRRVCVKNLNGLSKMKKFKLVILISVNNIS